MLVIRKRSLIRNFHKHLYLLQVLPVYAFESCGEVQVKVFVKRLLSVLRFSLSGMSSRQGSIITCASCGGSLIERKLEKEKELASQSLRTFALVRHNLG